MKKTLLIFLTATWVMTAKAQITPTDTAATGTITITKDPRLEILGKKQQDFNKAATYGPRAAKGYRLLVLSSNDRNYVMKVRAELLQNYPEQKVYMTFQAPYIKLKFGDFTEKSDADMYKRFITSAKIVNTSVYLVQEVVEVKGTKEEEDNK
jgi:hypothetical protein